jgi:hypothetical protein
VAGIYFCKREMGVPPRSEKIKEVKGEKVKKEEKLKCWHGSSRRGEEEEERRDVTVIKYNEDSFVYDIKMVRCVFT